MFQSVSVQFNLPENLLYSLCYVESKHQVGAVHIDDGKSSSLGICQVKYNTAKWLGYEGSENDLMDAYTNIYYAGKYLAYQRSRYQSNTKAIIAYNTGHAKSLTKTNYSDKVNSYWGTVNNEHRWNQAR